jgi:hypothetical protein
MFSTSKRDILKIKMKHSLLINYNIDYFIIAEYRWPWLLRKGVSVLRRLKTCVSSAMKNNRLSSLGLMHIHRDFEVDLYKAMAVFTSAKTGRADF